MTIGPRIAVIGTAGSGKTTVAAHLSAILSIPHIELDSLHWGPGWAKPAPEDFRRRVDQALSGPAWVTDGNYSEVRPIVWARANVIVWLDYPLPIILWQLTWRTLDRIVRRAVLWNENRETFRGVFFCRDSLFLYAITSHPRHRKTFPVAFAQPEYAHLKVIHLRSRKETGLWLDQVALDRKITGLTES